MSATYDPNLATDMDWVRFQVGDRDVSNALLQDEEINAILAEEENKYLAAARCGNVILARFRGVKSKTVANTTVMLGGSTENEYTRHLCELKKRGCQLLLGRDNGGSVLRVL